MIVIETNNGREVDVVVDRDTEVEENLDLKALPSKVVAEINVKNNVNRINKIYQE